LEPNGTRWSFLLHGSFSIRFTKYSKNIKVTTILWPEFAAPLFFFLNSGTKQPNEVAEYLQGLRDRVEVPSLLQLDMHVVME
jgi:hypothetical protein